MTKQFLTKTRWLVTIILLITFAIPKMWGETVYYQFTSKSFANSANAWDCNTEGNQFTANQGVQCTTGKRGKATTKSSVSNVRQVTVTYCTNASSGVGHIDVQIGSNTKQEYSVTKASSGGTTLKSATFTYTTPQSGKVSVQGYTTTNSIFIWAVTIVYDSGSETCNDVDVTGGSAIILPAGSTTYTTNAWKNNGAPTAYSTTPAENGIGTGDYCVVFTQTGDNNYANGLQFKEKEGVILIRHILSNQGVDVEFWCTGTNGFTVELTGATAKTGQTGTVTIDTESTDATLVIKKVTANAGNVKYIKITPKASCSADPTVGAASINGSFTLSSLTDNITNSSHGLGCSGSNTGSASCHWADRGFVWDTESNPDVNDHKEAGGSGDQATGWAGTLHPATSWAVGTTYYTRAYGKNEKTGAAFVYGTQTSFTLRAITFHPNGGSDVATMYVNSGGTYSAPTTPTKTGYTFEQWYQEEGLTNPVDWTAAVSENKEYYANWTAKTTTVSFNQNSGTGGQTSSVTATYGQAMPTPITTPTREGYTFGGYYDGAGGTGTQYYTSTGASNRNWDKENTTYTLYAKWTEKSLTNYRTNCCTDPELTFLDGEGDPTTEYTIVREDLASSSTAVEIACDFESNNTTSSITWSQTKRIATTYHNARTWSASQTDRCQIILTDPTNKKISAYETGSWQITISQSAGETSYCDATATVNILVKTVDKFVDAVNGNFSGEPQRLEDVGNGILLPTEETFTTNNACHSTTRRLVGWIKASDLNSYRTGGRVNYIDDLKTSGKVIAPGTRVEASGVTWYAVWGEEVVAP